MTSIRFLFKHGTGAVLVAAAVAFLAACGGKQAPPQMPPAPVEVMVAQPQQVPLVRSATGRLSAYRNADVRARVSGVLLKRTYHEGTHVEKGQKLFQIDPAPLKAKLDSAKASLAQARAKYTNDRIAAKRAHKLAPKGYISKSDLDNAEAAERSSLASVKAAKAQVEDAQINLHYASVTAPISGRAGKEQVTEGALVGQGSATLLTTVRQINPLYLNFSIPVNELQQLRADQARGGTSLSGTHSRVHITLPDGNAYDYTGSVDFAGASVDPSTGAVTLRALVPNPRHVLLPGMYAHLKVDLGTLNHAYVIPQNAIQRDANSAYVLTVDKDNKVVRKNVVTGRMKGGDWIVTSGLDAGDHVIVSGVAKAQPGAKVKPKIATKPSSSSGGQPAGSGSSRPAPPASAPAAPSSTR